MSKRLLPKVVLLVSFIACLYVNYISNAWPLNGFTAGELSDKYPNQFTPAGFTFAIWSVIYLATSVALVSLLINNSDKIPSEWYYNFSVINILNFVWLFCWHYQKVFLSVVVMISLLVSLILLYENVRKKDTSLFAQKALRVMTSLYMSWISVALIANLTAFLVDKNILIGNILIESLFSSFLLITAAFICWQVTKRYNDFLHPLVLAWASFGVFSKINSQSFQASNYLVITAICVIIISILISIQNARRSMWRTT